MIRIAQKTLKGKLLSKNKMNMSKIIGMCGLEALHIKNRILQNRSDGFMKKIVEIGNLKKVFQRVVLNKGVSVEMV